MKQDLNQFSKKLNYTFRNIQFLELALTHRSASKTNNERLEFLGDSILNFVVARIIYERFPKVDEGAMSRLRAHLVNEKTLSQIAKTIDLGQAINLGVGELKSGGHQRPSILADCLEAIIAAIYLDSGMREAEKLIQRLFENRLDEIDDLDALKDPKSRLQEYLQARRLPLPEYDLIEEKGDAHNKTFVVKCSSGIIENPVVAEGSSRRRAEQAAAESLLNLIQESEDV